MLALSSYSGIVLNQNQTPPATNSYFQISSGTAFYQTFVLPDDYARGESSAQTIPALTGFQLFVSIPTGQQALASLTWSLDMYDGTWNTLSSGTAKGAALDGSTWMSVYLPTPVKVTADMLTREFRINLLNSSSLNGVFYSSPNPLRDGFAFYADDQPVTSPTYTLTASATNGSNRLTGFSASRTPSAGDLIVSADLAAPTSILSITGSTLQLSESFTGATGSTAFTGGPSLSFMFRVLAATADSGTDFLGNVYRSVATAATADAVQSLSTPGEFSSWLSQPYPSAFGVASLYLDVSQFGSAVIDRFTLDPLTPGVYFHLYYSNDVAGPGTDPSSWEDLLWTPIYQTYRAERRQTFALPGPIAAKYIKVEFSGLQAKAYDAGAFQRPTIYKKYPKWILDYFIEQFRGFERDMLSSGVAITYDALDLAYNYYTADILSDPQQPAQALASTPSPNPFTTSASAIDQVDPVSLAQIDLGLSPFTAQPALLSDPRSILGSYARSVATPNYSVENIRLARGDTSVVSNTIREPLLIERAFPSMFFFLPCRHAYRLAQAIFPKNIAYFAGVKSLVLHREIYTGAKDQAQYNEILGDGTNIAFNDFQAVAGLTPLKPLTLFPAIVLQ